MHGGAIMHGVLVFALPWSAFTNLL